MLLESLGGAAFASGLGAGAEGKVPAVRRGASHGVGWASGWLGHCRLHHFQTRFASFVHALAVCLCSDGQGDGLRNT